MEHLDLLQAVAGVLDELKIRYFVTGSVASMVYGEIRFTRDVDFVIAPPLGLIRPFCERFPEPEFHVSTDAAMQAASTSGMFNIIHVPTALRADLMMSPEDAFDESAFRGHAAIASMNDTSRSSPPPRMSLSTNSSFTAKAGRRTSARCRWHPQGRRIDS